MRLLGPIEGAPESGFIQFDRNPVTREPICGQPASNRTADVVVSDAAGDQIAGIQERRSPTALEVRRLRRALLEAVRRLDDDDDA